MFKGDLNSNEILTDMDVLKAKIEGKSKHTKRRIGVRMWSNCLLMGRNKARFRSFRDSGVVAANTLPVEVSGCACQSASFLLISEHEESEEFNIIKKIKIKAWPINTYINNTILI